MTTPQIQQHLQNLGITHQEHGTAIGNQFVATDKVISSYSPVDGAQIAEVSLTSEKDYEQIIKASQEAFKTWRKLPAPKRGEIVRSFGEALREKNRI